MKVRTLTNDMGTSDSLGPSGIAELVGFKSIPEPGEELVVVENEKLAKEIVDSKIRQKLDHKQAEERIAMRQKEKSQLQNGKVEIREAKEIPAVIKVDALGSLQAIETALGDFPQDEVKLRVIRSGVGEVTEADVESVGPTGAVFCFSTKITQEANAIAKVTKTQIFQAKVIYELLDNARDFLSKFLEPKIETDIIGTAEILQVFKITNKKAANTVVAGCAVLSGSIHRSSVVRLMRGTAIVFEGKIFLL